MPIIRSAIYLSILVKNNSCASTTAVTTIKKNTPEGTISGKSRFLKTRRYILILFVSYDVYNNFQYKYIIWRYKHNIKIIHEYTSPRREYVDSVDR